MTIVLIIYLFQYYFDGSEEMFDSLTELISSYSSKGENNNKIGLIRLLYPSQFDKINSLKLCADLDNSHQKEKPQTGPSVSILRFILILLFKRNIDLQIDYNLLKNAVH